MRTGIQTATSSGAGMLIREWRQRRRMSQLDVALDAEISQRHLSFVESGRSSPSRDMVLRLAETLAVPLRQRNQMLVAAGFAPTFGERRLEDPSFKPALAAVELVLKGHEPYPALAIDRHWNMVSANAALAPFLEGVADQQLLAPPINVLRLSLHPKGIASRIVNLDQWRTHLIERLRLQIDASGDPDLEQLEQELSAYPGRPRGSGQGYDAAAAIAVPLKLRMGDRVLSFISTTTVFGTPLDVTLSELAIESFFPADAETGEFLRATAAA